jgi:gas vesicle protein
LVTLLIWESMFQFGEFYSEGGSSFWESLLAALIGALIGAGSALLVFYLETRRERRVRDEEKHQSYSDTFKYFVALIKETIDWSEKQANSYKEYSEHVQSNPIHEGVIQNYL